VIAVHDAGRAAGSVDTSSSPALPPVMHSPALGQARNWPDPWVVDVVQAETPPSGFVDVYTEESGPFDATAAQKLTVGQATALTATSVSAVVCHGVAVAGLAVVRTLPSSSAATHNPSVGHDKESMLPVGIVALSVGSGALHARGGLAAASAGAAAVTVIAASGTAAMSAMSAGVIFLSPLRS
jgi:hypothetical protein